MKALFTTLAVTGILTLASQAQYLAQPVNQPYYGGLGNGFGNFFIGASYGFADNSDSIDAFQGDDLFSLEFGSKYNLQNGLQAIFSAEVFGTGEDFIFENSDSTFSDIEATSIAVMVNAKLSYQVHPAFSFYAGGGLGVTTSIIEEFDRFGSLGRDSESVLGYQFFAGVEVNPFGNQVGFFAQYRYVNGDEFDASDLTAINDSFFDLGARFYF